MIKDSQISLETALKWISARKERGDIAGVDFLASRIPMEDAKAIQAETGAVFLRAYNGYDDKAKKYKLILVGVDAEGNDILNLVNTKDADDSQIYDLTLPCPDTCSSNSPLFTGII